MRLLDGTDDAELVEVRAGRVLRGRFERATSEAQNSTLSFVTEEGKAFLVANDPAGPTVGTSIEVLAYPHVPFGS
jgi:hypothetical protein